MRSRFYDGRRENPGRERILRVEIDNVDVCFIEGRKDTSGTYEYRSQAPKQGKELIWCRIDRGDGGTGERECIDGSVG